MDRSTAIESARAAHMAGGDRLSAVVTPAVRLILVALFLALLVRTLVIEPFAIPSGSMSPGLEAGDFIFVDKMAYGWSRASLPIGDPVTSGEGQLRINARPVLPGDVIVFGGPSGQDYVKRVIGRGGDRVALRAGRVLVNGQVLPCVPMADGLCREVLPNGASHVVRENGQSALATYPEIVVPPGHYFVLGDNRDASADSRVPRAAGGVGLVAGPDVIGRAQRIFFSARDGVRWRRIGQRID